MGETKRLRTIPRWKLKAERKPPPKDPRKFDPNIHRFPEGPEVPKILEYKLDVIIAKLHAILQAVQSGFGCLIPLLLGILAMLALILGLLSSIQALLGWIFALLAFWTVQLLVKRIIFGQPITPRIFLMPIIWVISGGLVVLIILSIGWLGGGVPATSTPPPTSPVFKPPEVKEVTTTPTLTPIPSTPTPTVTLEETVIPPIVFQDPKDDTFDRSNNQPYSDPAADITDITITRSDYMITTTIQTTAPFSCEDYSYAISTVVTDTLGSKRIILYEVHESMATIGEVDSNYHLVDGSPFNVTYDYQTGQLSIGWPVSYFGWDAPPYTLWVETFHMSAPSSVWTGDEAGPYGPFEFPGGPPTTSSAETSSGSQPMLYLDTGAFCRAGPNKEYPEEWSLNTGDTAPIVGSYPNGWWLVKIDDPRTRTECCWVGTGTVQGNISNVPTITTLPPGGSCP
jgi:hypothetical protein